MIFDHVVKHNGVRYPAGTDVPIEDVKPTETKVVETTDENNTVPVSKKRGRPMKKD